MSNNTEEVKKTSEQDGSKKRAVVFRPQNIKDKPKRQGAPEGRNNGERRSFNGERRPAGERKDGENRGERRPFNGEGRRDGERRPFSGERKDGENRGERRPYGERKDGENRGENRGERRPFNGEGRSFGDRNNGGDRRGQGNDRRDSGMSRSEAFSGKPSQNTQKPSKKQENRNKGKYDKKHEREENFANLEKSNLKKQTKQQAKVEEEIKTLVLPEKISLKDLADMMKMQPTAIIKKLFMQGKMVTVNQEISFEEAEEIAIEYEIMCERQAKEEGVSVALGEQYPLVLDAAFSHADDEIFISDVKNKLGI